MVRLYLFFILFSLNTFAGHLTIQEYCEGERPLFLAEGDFLTENKYRLPSEINSLKSLENFLSMQIKDELELSLFINNLRDINSSFYLERSQTRKVILDDLLFNRTSECEYNSIIEIKDSKILVSPFFDQLSQSDQIYHLLIASIYIDIDQDSNVGVRNYAYELLNPAFPSNTDKEKVRLRSLAGFDVFYKYSTQVDIKKIEVYNNDESIRIARLIDGSDVYTPNGVCQASDTRPALFDRGILAVFSVKNKCSLKFTSGTFNTLPLSTIEIQNYKIYTNDPIDPYIKSIYVSSDTVVQDDFVHLRASKNSLKKSKLEFFENGSENIQGYIQFLGYIRYNNQWLKITDYMNQYRMIPNSPINYMVIDDIISFFQAGYTNLFTGWIQFQSSGTLYRATITGDNPRFKIQNQQVAILTNSEVIFYNKNLPMIFTLGKDTTLKFVNGNETQISKGSVITLNQEGLVENYK